MNEKTVLAIDPGSVKCGIALVTRDAKGELQIKWRVIVKTSHLIEKMGEAKDLAPYELVIVGNGTNSSKVITAIREAWLGVAILVVDEKDTTLHARERYWMERQRHGWRRLLPATLQVPPEPIDDFAAFILAERVLTAS